MTEDEMVAWHHRVNGHEFEQALGDRDGRGSLACCSLDTTLCHLQPQPTEEENKSSLLSVAYQPRNLS